VKGWVHEQTIVQEQGCTVAQNNGTRVHAPSQSALELLPRPLPLPAPQSHLCSPVPLLPLLPHLSPSASQHPAPGPKYRTVFLPLSSPFSQNAAGCCPPAFRNQKSCDRADFPRCWALSTARKLIHTQG